MKIYSVVLTKYEDFKDSEGVWVKRRNTTFLPFSSEKDAIKEKSYWTKSDYTVKIICEEDENS